uniref:histone H1-like n=1 Tax=Pristiophorus japonicus TaxID=55135 RepID=UPI00398EA856
MPKVRRAGAGADADAGAVASPAAPKKAGAQPRLRRQQRKKELRVSQMILQALSARKQRGGLSLASLRKVLLANGYDAQKNQARVQLAIRSLVNDGSLVQTQATGSFRLNEGRERQAKEGELQAAGEATRTTGQDKSAATAAAATAAKKPRKRRAEKKGKSRKPRK